MNKIFLDLDGTLLDSSKRHEVLLNEILNEYGFNIDISDYLIFKSNGYSTKEYLINIKKIDFDTARSIADEWVCKIEDEEYIVLDSWYDDCLYFLDYLKNNYFEIVLLTARRSEETLMKFLDKKKYLNNFDEIVVVSPQNARNDKKNVICNNLTQVCIVVGDTENDYFDDISGVHFFMLNRGFRSKKFWDSRNIKSYLDLLCIKEQIESLLKSNKPI